MVLNDIGYVWKQFSQKGAKPVALHGKIGKVKNGSNLIAGIKEWGIDCDRDEKDVTAFGDSGLPWRVFAMGLIGATGKLSGSLDMGDTNGQFALWQSFTSDTPLTLNLQTDSATPHQFAVSAFITKMGMGVKLDDVEDVSFDFRVTGAPVYS